MDYELTHAQSMADLEEIADLMAKVFASKSYFAFHKTRMDQQTKDPYFKPEFSRIIRKDGRIVSHVSIVEKHLRIGRAVVRTAGIGDVCTHPDHRGKGYTNILMNDAIDYMGRSRFPLTMLYGIMNFYHRFGYIEAVPDYRMVVPAKNLKGLAAAAAPRPFREDDLKAVNALYNRAFEDKTLSAHRIESAWYSIKNPKTCFVVPDKKDRPIAYMITSAPPDPPTLTFHIKEAVAFDAESAAALAVFARDKSIALYKPDVEIHQIPGSYFTEYLADFGGVQTTKLFAEGEGQGMLRIVLLRELLEDIREELTRRLRGAADALAGVQIAFKTDAGNAVLAAGPEGVEILDKPAKGAKAAVNIKTPQNALVRLLVGYWSVERFLRRIDARRIPEPAQRLLEILFPPSTPCTCEADYF